MNHEDGLSHLDPALQELVRTGSPTQRIAALDTEVFVAHDAASVAMDGLMVMFRSRRPCGALVLAESGMGKSTLVTAFGRRLALGNQGDGSAPTDIVVVEPSWEGDADRFQFEIARALKLNVRSVMPLFEQIVNQMISMNLAAVCIEDLHDLFEIQPRRYPRWLKVIRRLVNISRIPIVCTCLHSALEYVCQDEQFDRRFLTKVDLPVWQFDENFRNFLSALEKTLPLKQPSNLASRDMMKWLLKNAATTKRISEVIQSAARLAIEEGTEKVSLESLKAHFTAIPFTPRAGRDTVGRQTKSRANSEGTIESPGGITP